MRKPKKDQQIALLENRIEQYRLQHYQLSVDIEMARATEAEDVEDAVENLENSMRHIEKACVAAERMLAELKQGGKRSVPKEKKRK